MDKNGWPTFLSDPSDIFELYDRPPALGSCDLFYVHIDERETSITFGFETRQPPSRPKQKWKEKEFNSINFFLYFTGTSQLRINGWGCPGQKNVDILRGDEGGMNVRVSSDGSHIEFRAESASIAHVRAFLAASGS
ncbi:Imm50 family immunity protein [Streptomyces sp. NPDC051320]|uniref:Imm50 family immunity protein n=1 Tax=Streptomyces sp. NPDC051320 TaxID=3154644 RepID=UPI00341ACE8E